MRKSYTVLTGAAIAAVLSSALPAQAQDEGSMAVGGATVTVGVGAPLSAFGIGSAGTVSLNLSHNAGNASARAQLKIPFGSAE